MSVPCFDSASDAWDDADYDDTAWMGDIHATSEWEVVQESCGPEYRLDWTGFYSRAPLPTRTLWQHWT